MKKSYPTWLFVSLSLVTWYITVVYFHLHERLPLPRTGDVWESIMQAVITLMMAISLAYIALEVYRYARKYYILYKTKKDPLKP